MSDELNNGQTPEQPGQNYGNPYYSGGQEKMTGILEAYKAYWKNYVNFKDRTSRAGYWWVILINGVISMILSAVLLGPAMTAVALAAADPTQATAALFAALAGTGIIFIIWSLANILPSLAIAVRRLHDTGKSWIYVLLPYVGTILSVFFMRSSVAMIILGLLSGVLAIVFIVFMAKATKYPPENRFYDRPKQG
ncbi:MAG: DUF805 domain-containing protein [Clostridiales Family XIII bacterium]|jgi:uncharacterized membrane protein YhaH (DUF805 family)|nr:DUF805 domain-containing protein [Clostridiales Family XIII bacterium]